MAAWASRSELLYRQRDLDPNIADDSFDICSRALDTAWLPTWETSRPWFSRAPASTPLFSLAEAPMHLRINTTPHAVLEHTSLRLFWRASTLSQIGEQNFVSDRFWYLMVTRVTTLSL